MSAQEFYVCQRSGNCCRAPGYVVLTHEEPGKIAALLGLSEADFNEKFTDLHDSRQCLRLKIREDGACIFLEGINNCGIQVAKPVQCRQFPNGWKVPGWRSYCQAKLLEEG